MTKAKKLMGKRVKLNFGQGEEFIENTIDIEDIPEEFVTVLDNKVELYRVVTKDSDINLATLCNVRDSVYRDFENMGVRLLTKEDIEKVKSKYMFIELEDGEIVEIDEEDYLNYL